MVSYSMMGLTYKRFFISGMIAGFCSSSFAAEDTDNIRNYNYIASFNIGETSFLNSKDANGYGNSLGFGLAAQLTDNWSLGLSYTDIDVTESSQYQLNYLGSNLTYSYPVNSKVAVDISAGIGYPLTDLLSAREQVNDLFPIADLGFSYRLSESWSVGAGYQHLFNLTKENSELNNIYLAIKFSPISLSAKNALPENKNIALHNDNVGEVTSIDSTVSEVEVNADKVSTVQTQQMIFSYFELEKYTLNKAEERHLLRVIRKLDDENEIKKIRANVNTDGSGNAELNQMLNSRREEYTRNLLTDLTSVRGEDLVIRAKVNNHSTLYYQCAALQEKKAKEACLRPDRVLEVILYSEK